MTDEEIRQELRNKKKRQRTRKRLIIAILAMAAVVAGAYYAGTAIGNHRYESKLKNFTPVTEEMPLINTAMSQLGNKGGETYWKWFGYGRRVEWCAIFVSWCMDQCGYIDGMKAPSFENVGDGGGWFERHDQWLDKGSTPEPGDLIFFDWQQDGDRDHVGIVTSVKDGMVFTVEGNSSDRCRQKRYFLDDPVIFGYAQINE